MEIERLLQELRKDVEVKTKRIDRTDEHLELLKAHVQSNVVLATCNLHMGFSVDVAHYACTFCGKYNHHHPLESMVLVGENNCGNRVVYNFQSRLVFGQAGLAYKLY